MRRLLARTWLALAAAVLVPACGKSSSGGAYTIPLYGGGGRADGGPSKKARGGAGGSIDLHPAGDAFVGRNPAPAAPAMPAVPAVGLAITSADVAGAAYTRDGTILIQGRVVTGGDCTITANWGDIVVSGTLECPDQGNLTLQAPNGSVYITGTVRSALDALSDGDAGGRVEIGGVHVWITGRLEARGEDNANGTGGAGGRVAIAASTGFANLLGAAVDVSGGNGAAATGGCLGGSGGEIILNGKVGAAVHRSTLLARGGRAQGVSDTQGGMGGTIIAESEGDLALDSFLDMSGGDASASSGEAGGGFGGHLYVGSGPSSNAFIYGTFQFGGGNGTSAQGKAFGGNGGSLGNGGRSLGTLNMAEAHWALAGGNSDDEGGSGGNASIMSGGILEFSGLADVSGGTGVLWGGGSGSVWLVSQGPFQVKAGSTLTARGGYPGGSGGQVRVGSEGDSGASTCSVDAAISVSGGDGNSYYQSGTGGIVLLHTCDSDLAIAGSILLQGGSNFAPGGKGGTGGGLQIVTDFDGDDVNGNVLLSARVNASGGSGAVAGGGARNDNNPGFVGDFETGQICLWIDADGDLANPGAGTISITGVMIARGGSPDGNGGDVLLRGTMLADPPAGSSNAGSGEGLNGDVQLNGLVVPP